MLSLTLDWCYHWRQCVHQTVSKESSPIMEVLMYTSTICTKAKPVEAER